MEQKRPPGKARGGRVMVNNPSVVTRTRAEGRTRAASTRGEASGILRSQATCEWEGEAAVAGHRSNWLGTPVAAVRRPAPSLAQAGTCASFLKFPALTDRPCLSKGQPVSNRLAWQQKRQPAGGKAGGRGEAQRLVQQVGGGGQTPWRSATQGPGTRRAWKKKRTDMDGRVFLFLFVEEEW